MNIATIWSQPNGPRCTLSFEDDRFVITVSKHDQLVLTDAFDSERPALIQAEQWRRQFNGDYWPRPRQSASVDLTLPCGDVRPRHVTCEP